MKRVGNIYEEITRLGNIESAIMHASKGKRKRKKVEKILDSPTFYALQIQKMLKEKTYVPSPYFKIKILDGVRKKERIIYKPQFYPDQVIHWALMLKLEPILQKSMYEFCCASIKKRGIHYGKRHIERILNNDRKNTKYCLKLDIRHFYPNIDKEILKQKFRKKIKDKDTLWLIDTIIDSGETGVPIGNYTSQWFANFYLEDLDHYIKEQLKVKHYVRYMDDMVLFSKNKKELHKIRLEVDSFVRKEHLTIKDNWQLFKVESRPIDFLGYRFNRDPETKEVYTTLRKSNFLRFKRRIKKIHKKIAWNVEQGKPKYNFKDACAVMSIIAWVKKSDGYGYLNKYILDYINIADCKEVIRNETRKRLEASKKL